MQALARATATQQTHKVQAGESIQAIAKRYGITPDALAAANQGKIKTWKTGKGSRSGFNAGELIVIPSAAAAPAAAAAPKAAETVPAVDRPAAEEGLGSTISHAADWVAQTWHNLWAAPAPAAAAPAQPVATPQATPAAAPAAPAAAPSPQPAAAPAAQTPADVIKARVADGTFTQNVTVNSTKRDGDKQLKILRSYCKQNKTALNSYADETDWLKDSLDWDAFESAEVADESVWLPFFFALYYGGGGPGVASDDRTLPLVASPKQTTWVDKKGKTKTANASPHIAGRAMDVDATDLELLEKELKTKIPEFSATGAFPIKSTQLENVSGQSAVHVNFKNVVF